MTHFNSHSIVHTSPKANTYTEMAYFQRAGHSCMLKCGYANDNSVVSPRAIFHLHISNCLCVFVFVTFGFEDFFFRVYRFRIIDMRRQQIRKFRFDKGRASFFWLILSVSLVGLTFVRMPSDVFRIFVRIRWCL